MSEKAAAYQTDQETAPFVLSITDIARIAYNATATLRMTQGGPFPFSWQELSKHEKGIGIELVRWIAMNDQVAPEVMSAKKREIMGMPAHDWREMTEKSRACDILFWAVARSMVVFVAWPE